jgi:hypothetical protein
LSYLTLRHLLLFRIAEGIDYYSSSFSVYFFPASAADLSFRRESFPSLSGGRTAARAEGPSLFFCLYPKVIECSCLLLTIVKVGRRLDPVHLNKSLYSQ